MLLESLVQASLSGRERDWHLELPELARTILQSAHLDIISLLSTRFTAGCSAGASAITVSF
jgi:hypothetical protein